MKLYIRVITKYKFCTSTQSRLRRRERRTFANGRLRSLTGTLTDQRVPTHFFYAHFLSIRLPLKLERGARPPIYLPFPSSPRTLQEIEVTRLSVCVATAVESQLRFPTAVESQTCLSVCVPAAVESQALSGRIKHSESLIYPY